MNEMLMFFPFSYSSKKKKKNFPELYFEYQSAVAAVLMWTQSQLWWRIPLWRPWAERNAKTQLTLKEFPPSLQIKSLFFLPLPLGDQLPKQTAAVMNVINMIDGISAFADLTPRARVLGAGAVQIYSPLPHVMIISLLLSPTQRRWALLRRCHT